MTRSEAEVKARNRAHDECGKFHIITPVGYDNGEAPFSVISLDLDSAAAFSGKVAGGCVRLGGAIMWFKDETK